MIRSTRTRASRDAASGASFAAQLLAWLASWLGAWVRLLEGARAPLALGPLSSVVCGPQVRRIHHSRLPQHRDRTFARYFPVLDRLFGTWHAPARDEFPPTGADAHRECH